MHILTIILRKDTKPKLNVLFFILILMSIYSLFVFFPSTVIHITASDPLDLAIISYY
jgi:hypothetical protein